MIYYLDDRRISFRAKGILASALHAFPEKKCSAAQFVSEFSHDHMNAEYLFKFVLEELEKPGYLKPSLESPVTYEICSYSD